MRREGREGETEGGRQRPNKARDQLIGDVMRVVKIIGRQRASNANRGAVAPGGEWEIQTREERVRTFGWAKLFGHKHRGKNL